MLFRSPKETRSLAVPAVGKDFFQRVLGQLLPAAPYCLDSADYCHLCCLLCVAADFAFSRSPAAVADFLQLADTYLNSVDPNVDGAVDLVLTQIVVV